MDGQQRHMWNVPNSKHKAEQDKDENKKLAHSSSGKSKKKILRKKYNVDQSDTESEVFDGNDNEKSNGSDDSNESEESDESEESSESEEDT